MKIPAEWRPLVRKTIETIDGIDKMKGRKQPLSKSILEFSQLLAMLALVGGKEFDEIKEGDAHDEEGNQDDSR